MPKVNLIYKPNYKAVSKNIMKLLIEQERSRGELAEDSFINYKTLCNKLKNTPKHFNVEELAYMAKSLNVPVEKLLEGL